MTLKAGGAFSNGVPLLRHIESTVYQEVYCIDPRGAKIVCGELDDSTSIETFPLAQMVSEFHGASFAEDRILILGAYSSVPSMIANAHNMNHYNLRPFYGCITKSNGFPLLYVGSDRPLENHRHHYLECIRHLMKKDHLNSVFEMTGISDRDFVQNVILTVIPTLIIIVGPNYEHTVLTPKSRRPMCRITPDILSAPPPPTPPSFEFATIIDVHVSFFIQVPDTIDVNREGPSASGFHPTTTNQLIGMSREVVVVDGGNLFSSVRAHGYLVSFVDHEMVRLRISLPTIIEPHMSILFWLTA